MDKPARPNLSDAERDVLRALWDEGPGTVRQIRTRLNARGRTWAYTTVLTLLQRLLAKDCVSSDTSGSAHVFRAEASRDDLLQDRLQVLARELCDGASAPLVLALVKNHAFSPEEIAKFRAILDGHDGSK
ncbi:MAG: blaI 2 [Planctomycetota bacterium]|nr:blaI 2 [Planctomycetota bacterium]